MLRKRISALGRRPDLDGAAFDAHWRSLHVPHILALPGVVGYVQNRSVQGGPVDGLAEVWFEPQPGVPAVAHHSAAQQADERSFLGALTGLTVEEGARTTGAATAWLALSGAMAPAALDDLLGDAPRTEHVVDPAVPVMRRDFLADAAAVPERLVAVRFEDVESAVAAVPAVGTVHGMLWTVVTEPRVVLAPPD